MKERVKLKTVARCSGDLREFTIPDGILAEAARELMRWAINDDDYVFATLPTVWYPTDGTFINPKRLPPPEDPLTVRIGCDDGEPCFLKDFSLGDEIRGYVVDCEHDGSFAPGLARISEAMKLLAQRIDTAVAKHAVGPAVGRK